MAVIQDLPQELIIKVSVHLGRSSSSSKDLRSTSLVARAWSTPSQELRRYNLPCWPLSRLSASLAHSTRAVTLRRVVPRPSQSAETLRMLSENEVTVQTLTLQSGSSSQVDLSAMSLKLFSAVEVLQLRANFRGQPTIPSELGLQELWLDAHYPPPTTFLHSLLRAAPLLTRLELSTGLHDEFADHVGACLYPIAHQLTHLAIIDCPAVSDPAFRFRPFLAACTSLKSLKLLYTKPSGISKVLSALQSTLVLFETDLRTRWEEKGQGVADLVAVLDLHALTQLRRWRLYTTNSMNVLRGTDRGHWEAACRARGVEPRDERRFFTDYPAE